MLITTCSKHPTFDQKHVYCISNTNLVCIKKIGNALKQINLIDKKLELFLMTHQL